MASVMISHSHEDTAPEEVAMFFAGEGVDVWFDDWELVLGDSVTGGMEVGLARATHVIVMWSRNAAASKWVTEERRSAITRAVNTGVPKVIVVRLDDEPLPAMLDHRKYHRWRGGSEEDRRALIDGVLGGPPSQAYVRAIVKKAQELTVDWEDDSGDPLPFKACPSCGGPRLRRSSATDWAHDRTYYFIRCEECGWGDWTE